MSKKLHATLLILLATMQFAFSQNRVVSGKITSGEDGSALPGVNVVVKGTKSGTITDINGAYNINVGDDAVLVLSYIGFISQEVPVGAQSTIDVVLSPDDEVLQEVVVTALGIEKESRTIGYGISSIKSDEVTKARETNIVNALQGKVTGVNIQSTSGNLGASSKIIIRGVTSLSGRNNPLWIVDGIPINNEQTSNGTGSRITGNRDFSNGAAVINPDDVESINILKGAAATALYGSRAAAGAIVVTTKRGKVGNGGKPQVSINSTARFDNLFVRPDYQEQYGIGFFATYDSSLVTSFGPRIAGQEVSKAITGERVPLQAYGRDNLDNYFETGVTLINNISVSDADERMDYRLSLTSLNQSGILPASELDRLTIGLNAGVKHSEKLKTRFGVQYIRTTSGGTGVTGANDPNIVNDLSGFAPTVDWRDYRQWIDESGNQINQQDPTANNPYWVQNENLNDRENDRFIGNFELTYNPIKNLSLITRVGHDYDVDDRLITNRKGTAQRLEGNFRIDEMQRTQTNVDLIANYFLDFGSDWSLSILGGYQYNRRVFERETLVGNNLLIPELFSPGNAEQTVPTRDYSEQILMGAYSQAELTYKDWATLSVTARNDWSSTLPLANNSYFYPSASLAVVFTDALNINSKVLTYGKLRASVAQVGNDTGPYQLDFLFNPIETARGQYSLNLNFPFDGRLAFAKTNTIPPTNLLPEEQTSYEFGAELQFFNSRITLDMAYFKSENRNQILALPIPESTGFANRRTNIGQVDTEGIEITLDMTPVRIADFEWNSIVNFTHTESTVIELAEGVDQSLIASAFGSVQVQAVPGKEYQLFGIPYLRDSASGRPIINPLTGLRQAGDAKPFGSVFPDFTMGFINNFTWKGFTLSTTIDWRSGGIMKSSTVEDLLTSGLVEETLINREGTFIDRTGVLLNDDGTVRENNVPVQSAQAFWTGLDDNSISEPFIFDASFVKLRELSLSYRLPSSLLSKTKFISGAQVGIEGRNLALLWSRVPHLDPEANLFGAGSDGFGVERATVPSTRSVGFNVRLTF